MAWLSKSQEALWQLLEDFRCWRIIMKERSTPKAIRESIVVTFAGVMFWLGASPAIFNLSAESQIGGGKIIAAEDGALSPLQKGGRPKASGVYRDKVTPHWFADESRFWYRNDLKGGTKEFVLVDVEKGSRSLAFDHSKLAEALSKATNAEYKADRLPFNEIEFVNNAKNVQFEADGKKWKCDLETYNCSVAGPAGAKTAEPPADPAPVEADETNDSPWVDGSLFQQPIAHLQAQPKRDPDRARSPDGKVTAFVKDFNIYLKDTDGNDIQLTKDGKEGLAYGRLSWSPDSKSLVSFRIEAGDRKEVYLIESSPPGGGRAVLSTRPYELPGDKYTNYELHVFDVENRKDLPVEPHRFEFAVLYDSPRIRWNKDGHSFTFPKTERGHQRYRLIEVDARSGDLRNLIDEKTDTFIWTAHAESVNAPIVSWLQKTDEIIYVSEKSGWRHLYLIDAKTGKEKNAITSGEFVVRGLDTIDEEKRQVWFWASGKNPSQDPYFMHYYRINFDGTGLVSLTDGDGDHARGTERSRLASPQFSPKRKYIIDTYSRVDMPPVSELRRVEDGKLVCKLEESDITELKANGWNPLEVFSAKGRDGKTDICGVIARPRNFDPSKKYPVIESIYAGPQGSFVPKTFSPFNRYASMADLGFILVQIDGMGTANRSKAFHDVCWKNLKDAGYPDRILWHKAVAMKYPYYDISRVGVYGTSAGGQNAMGAVLFHGDFYKAAVAACGCHDNRMDKASWNEQWMGYPVGPQYAASSNVDNAYKLTGKLLLIVGEKDTNVPPESTMRVVDALIKAGKDFDLLVVPGMGHSNGGAYGTRRMQDFFIRHLQGIEPPDRNRVGLRGAAPANE
jgi:dipeptidyl aminopeptidase/acylaminoacyl peptidase